jgi:phosphoenolpyruvate synthase/pyruvate phosphate dikinase
MNISLEDAAFIYARACRAWYGKRALRVVKDQISALDRTGDRDGVRAWSLVADKLRHMPEHQPRARWQQRQLSQGPIPKAYARFYAHGKTYPQEFKAQVEAALIELGKRAGGKTFGDAGDPLLVSVRSGARASMPGMMDTVLNLGLNDITVEALARNSGDRRFAYDSYRRFIAMYANVVLGLDHHLFEEILDEHKDLNGYMLDTDLDAEDWAGLVVRYQERVAAGHGAPFPQDPHAQLWDAIGAVFGSWMNQRAMTYRRLHAIPESWGTAVNVQAMVFGNRGETSATGVAFPHRPRDQTSNALMIRLLYYATRPRSLSRRCRGGRGISARTC